MVPAGMGAISVKTDSIDAERFQEVGKRSCPETNQGVDRPKRHIAVRLEKWYPSDGSAGLLRRATRARQ
jgi:hypothetical protein